MDIHVETRGNVCVARLQGDLTIYQAKELKERLLALLTGSEELELDLAGVTELDTAGVQLLLLAKFEAGRAGKTLRLTSHSDAVRAVIDLYNLAARFGDPLVLPAVRPHAQ